MPTPVRFNNFFRGHWCVSAAIWRTGEAHSNLSPMHQIKTRPHNPSWCFARPGLDIRHQSCLNPNLSSARKTNTAILPKITKMPLGTRATSVTRRHLSASRGKLFVGQLLGRSGRLPACPWQERVYARNRSICRRARIQPLQLKPKLLAPLCDVNNSIDR